MKLRIFTEPQQGADYPTLRAVALAAEDVLGGAGARRTPRLVARFADEAEFRRRAAAIGWEPDAFRENGIGGTPDQVAVRIAEFAEIGAERVYLQVLDLSDLDHLALIASDVAPQV